jgi:exonuclease III
MQISMDHHGQDSRDISPPPIKRRRVEAVSQPKRLAAAASLPSRPITDLSPNLFRIFSWNVNGIEPFLQPSITSFFNTAKPRHGGLSDGNETEDEKKPLNQGYSLRGNLKRWKFPQVVCLQEVKIVPGDEQTKARVRQAVKAPESKKNQEPDYRVFFALPRDKFNAKGFRGKVYGVCMLVRNDVFIKYGKDQKVQVEDVSWDLEGRVLVVKIQSLKLAIFGVYAVNGTENPYRDPRTGEIIGTRHDRKRAFHTDLRDEVKRYKAQDWSVVIAGDINIARSAIDGFPGIRLAPAHIVNRTDFENKFMDPENGLGMVDAFRHLHGNERKYSYRSRGIEWGISCDRVDLILQSSISSKSLIEADILDTPFERGPSDHVPLYATLDLEALHVPEKASEQ